MSVTSQTVEAGESSHVIERIEGIDGGRGRNPVIRSMVAHCSGVP